MLPSAGDRSPKVWRNSTARALGLGQPLVVHQLEPVDLGGADAEHRGVAAQPAPGGHGRVVGGGPAEAAVGRQDRRRGAEGVPPQVVEPEAGAGGLLRGRRDAPYRGRRGRERPAGESPSVIRSGVAGAAWGGRRRPPPGAAPARSPGRRPPGPRQPMPSRRAPGSRRAMSVQGHAPETRQRVPGYAEHRSRRIHWIDPENLGYRPPVRAIRRFTVRPVLPEPLAALADLAVNLRWSWHPETQDVFRAMDPDLWESTHRDPVRLLGAVSRRAADRAGRRPQVPRDGRAGPRGPRRLPQRRPLVPAQGRATAAGRGPDGDRLLLPGVRHHRGAAAVLRRARHPRRRPPQDRLRPRRADHRRRPALPARLLPPVAVPRGLAAGDLPGPRPRRAAAVAAPRGRRQPAPRSASPVPGGRTLADAGSGSPRSAASRCCCSTPTSRRTPASSATSPTACTAAPPSTGCARSCCSASAASAPCAPTPASPAPRRPRSSTPTRATPASSASSGSASSPSTTTARSSTSTPRSRSPAPAPCSPPTPRSRPASTGSRATSSSSTSPATRRPPASRSSGSWRSAPRTTRAATPRSSTWR